jgi:hypothetical protein
MGQIDNRHLSPLRPPGRGYSRGGLATLDYVLILVFVLPMLVFIMRVAPRIIRAAYDVVCMQISWPFM